VGKVQEAPECRGAEFQAQNINISFLVTVKIRISGYQTLECFIATLLTGRHVPLGETFNRFAHFGL